MCVRKSSRPLANISIMRGKAKGNTIASVSKCFRLVYRHKNGDALRFDFVKVRAGRIRMEPGARLVVVVGRSGLTLSRMMMAKCKAEIQSTLTNSIDNLLAAAAEDNTSTVPPRRRLPSRRTGASRRTRRGLCSRLVRLGKLHHGFSSMNF